MTHKSWLYTGSGDKGTTSLVGGERVPKFHERLESYGTIDELSSFVGLLLCEELLPEDSVFLTRIQHKLFSVGSYLATNQDTTELMVPSRIDEKLIGLIESEIDRLDSSMPKMKGFILPAGGRSASLAHICRTICRRAERHIYRLMSEGASVEEPVLKYINRLSDYFFALGRKEGLRIAGKEIVWDQTCE